MATRYQVSNGGEGVVSDPGNPQVSESRPDPNPQPQIRINRGASRATVSPSGEVTFAENRPTSYQAREQGKNSSDPLDRARTQVGAPISRSQITLDSIVDYGGSTRVRELVSMGVLIQDANGFRWAGQQPPASKAGTTPAVEDKPDVPPAKDETADQPEFDASGIEATSVSADLTHKTVKAAIGDSTYEGLLNTLIRGKDASSMYETIAQRTGTSVEEARGGVEAVFGEYLTAAKSVARKYGVPDRAFYDFINKTAARDEGATFDAFHALVTSHNIAPLARLARLYASSGALETSYSPDEVLAADFGGGITARLDPTTNKVMLNIPNVGELSLEKAVRAGVIKVS